VPNWLSDRAARYIHSDQVTEHGGLAGPSREGLLEAALARPPNLYAYAPKEATMARLAASYGYGLCRGHCFPDGNKRLALVAMDVFLRMNGRQLTAAEEDAVVTMLAVAAGELTEDELAAWVGANSGPLAD
jgi:death-on-curing protein